MTNTIGNFIYHYLGCTMSLVISMRLNGKYANSSDVISVGDVLKVNENEYTITQDEIDFLNKKD